jgi:hypothetical protein
MELAGKNHLLILAGPIPYVQTVLFKESLAGVGELFRPDVRKQAPQELREGLRIGEIAGTHVGRERAVENFVLDALFPAHHELEGSRFIRCRAKRPYRNAWDLEAASRHLDIGRAHCRAFHPYSTARQAPRKAISIGLNHRGISAGPVPHQPISIDSRSCSGRRVV